MSSLPFMPLSGTGVEVADERRLRSRRERGGIDAVEAVAEDLLVDLLVRDRVDLVRVGGRRRERDDLQVADREDVVPVDRVLRDRARAEERVLAVLRRRD